MIKKFILLIVLVVVVVAGVQLYRTGVTTTDNVADDQVKAGDTSAADPGAIKRGAYVAIASDCVACHTAPGGQPFAGGYALKTPFGTLLASNITPDRETGIGNWTERDFFRAVRHGKSPHGELYAAMPYNDYVKLSDQDMHDLWAYMRTVKPVSKVVDSNQLPFPFSIRLVNLGWKMLFFDNHPFEPQQGQSRAWNRGYYLVAGAEHCAACHTPKNFLGGDVTGAYLQGGTLQGWYAPEIAGNPHTGLGSWSAGDVTGYLKNGSNGKAVASGPMAEAIHNSTQYLSDADLDAIAEYLKSVPGSSESAPQALAATDPQMQRGAHIYEVSCSACHNIQGQGVEGMVTAFASNPAIRSPGKGSLIQTLLAGGRAAITQSNPTGAGMPSFGWKLTDADAAAVLTYVRNSWGNAASVVTADEVTAARKAVRVPPPVVMQ